MKTNLATRELAIAVPNVREIAFNGTTWTAYEPGDTLPVRGLADGSQAASSSARPTVASLPPAALNEGERSFVFDAVQTFTAANFGVTVAGGGANKVPVSSDGTSWKIG